ncbi:hypothetical protein M422DRAFT_254812 [Sphaerobolus stellatus SS14]|uniref:Uncharacterized protein n=1 Tax=Sphaerobolus stellatus (strain SS14) TaxID=990650 RepID=A0A0C9UGD9_SPHS4|nr:hypothetical protein M422DRAFT_254812 [Sphaerobolus stellatus SS14]
MDGYKALQYLLLNSQASRLPRLRHLAILRTRTSPSTHWQVRVDVPNLTSLRISSGGRALLLKQILGNSFHKLQELILYAEQCSEIIIVAQAMPNVSMVKIRGNSLLWEGLPVASIFPQVIELNLEGHFLRFVIPFLQNASIPKFTMLSFGPFTGLNDFEFNKTILYSVKWKHVRTLRWVDIENASVYVFLYDVLTHVPALIIFEFD